MTVTVTGVNYLQMSSCDSTSAGGSWDSGSQDTAQYVEGNASLSTIMKSNGNNDVTFTPTSPVDLSGTKHVRFWFISTHGSLLNTKSGGGVQLGLTDGANTGYWYVSGRDEYPGGWYQAIIDISTAVDSGTKPTSMNAITDIIIRINLTSTAKNTDNFWWDNLIYCDGLTAYGDDGGSSFDFEDIYLADSATTGGWGVLKKFGGIYYASGSLTIGDTGTSSSDFVAKNQVVIFEDKSDYISSSLYSITVVGNSTGATQRFELGEKSGTAGINGCTIRCNATTLAFEFTATDTDVDDFGLYGSTFDTYGTIDLQPDGTNLEVLNCNFVNGQGQFQPNTMDVTNCNFISGPTAGNGTVLIESASHNITYCSFISNPDAIEISVASAIGFNNLTFTNNTYDVYNSSGSAITVTNTDSNASSYNPAGSTVSFETTVSIDIHIENGDGNSVEGAQVYMQKTNPTTYYSHATNNSQGDTTFEASASVDSDTPSSGWITVRAVDEKEWHWYRYASRSSTVFTFPPETTAQADNTDDSPTVLYDSGVNFLTSDIEEGDMIVNETDGSWAQVTKIIDADHIAHSPLIDGTDNHWDTGDTYSICSLAQSYDGSDTFTVPLINSNTDSDGNVSLSYNHPGGTVNAIIRVRHSPDSGTRYLPANVSASFTGSYSITITLVEDTIGG